jgi:hypothetical protein
MLDDKKIDQGLQKIKNVEMTKIINSIKNTKDEKKKVYYEIVLCIKKYLMGIYRTKEDFLKCLHVIDQKLNTNNTNKTKFGAFGDFSFSLGFRNMVDGLFNSLMQARYITAIFN